MVCHNTQLFPSLLDDVLNVSKTIASPQRTNRQWAVLTRKHRCSFGRSWFPQGIFQAVPLLPHSFLYQIFVCYKQINSEALLLRIYLTVSCLRFQIGLLLVFSFKIFLICQLDFTLHCQFWAPLSRKHFESIALFILFCLALSTVSWKCIYFSFQNYWKITIV